MAPPFGGVDMQRRLWETSSRWSRVILALAVFALFASLGFLTDVSTLGRSSPVA